MKVLSLFSGVGGFDMGLENSGMETVFQCEWDKHCRTILDRHWPTVPKWDDVSTLTGEHILTHAPVIDVVAWGSPCQDLSVAGKRSGLKGGRSGLFHEGIRIINELRKASNGKYPRISIWENVYGAINSNKGEDFEAILKEMVEAGSLLCEWRVLDAQYFGVPQRRRRVFVVAVFDSATANRCPDPLLPVSEGLLWHPKTGATTRQSSAGTTSASVRSSRAIIGSDIVGPLAASDWKFPQQQQVHENKCVVETFTKSRRAQSATDDETWVEGKPAPTLNSFNQGDVRATTVIVNQPMLLDGTRVDDVRVYESPVQTLKERMGTGGNNVPQILDSTLAVRRLTPIECERLMGWPDNWTEGQADTHRYKQCGNGVASPVAEWIGEQLRNL